MVTVKEIYQVCTLGIRFGGWITCLFKGRMEDWKLSGWNMKRFHKRRQVVLTQDIKALSFPQDQSPHLTLPVFSSGTYLQTHLSGMSKMCADASSLSCGLDDLRLLHFQRSERKTLDLRPSLLVPIISFTHVLVIISLYGSLFKEDSGYLPQMSRWKLKWWVSGDRALHVCPLLSQWHPTKGSHQTWDSVIYKHYQRSMMLKGKLKLCTRPTRSQSWEPGQTEWMYLLFMWKSISTDRWQFVFLTIYSKASWQMSSLPLLGGARVSKSSPHTYFPFHLFLFGCWHICTLQKYRFP